MSRNLRRISSFFPALRFTIHVDLTPQHIKHHLRHLITTNPSPLKPPPTPFPISTTPTFSASFTSSADESDSDGDDEVAGDPNSGDPCSSHDVKTIADILQTPGVQEQSKKLELCNVTITPQLVSTVLSRTRNDWERAFTFFLWAAKQPNYSHSVREYHSMIAILGKFRKFDTAWALIDDMRASSLDTPHTILIMIRRYAAVHDVAKAISAFYALRRFKFVIGLEEFQRFLAALCRYKNVRDAEYMLFCNKSVFPLTTKSFNIVLNGWCNVVGDVREGTRIWREMEIRGVKRDVYSYSSLISCHSKASSLNVVMRLYDEMKSFGIKPDRKVYNAVIHALAKARMLDKARSVMRTMEDEEGFSPDVVTYNSLIMPLCKLRMLDEAKRAFDEMTERGLVPTVRTYHGFFRVLRTGDEVFELLRRMYATGCVPTHETYIMLIRKFCRWRQLDDVFEVWSEMRRNGLDPDRSAYIVLIHGLFLNGKLEEAHKFYLEMKEKSLLPEPKIEAIIQAWLAGKNDSTASKDNQFRSTQVEENVRVKSKNNQRDNDFRRAPEMRSVIRERGFSFWER